MKGGGEPREERERRTMYVMLLMPLTQRRSLELMPAMVKI